MKKRLTAVLIAILVIILAAVGIMTLKPTPIGLVRRTARNLNKVSSVKADVSVEYEGSVTVSVLGAPVSVPFAVSTDLGVQAVTEPAASHIDGTVSASLYGVAVDTPLECYVREENGENVVYMSADHRNWVRHKVREPAEEEGREDEPADINGKAVLGLVKKIIDGEIRTELAEETETICGKEAYRIDVEVSGAILQQVLEIVSSGKNSSDIPEDLDLSGAGTKCEVYIYKKEKLPARVTIDCASLGNAVMQSLLEKQDFVAAADSFNVTATFTEYDTIDSIEIPEEVISGAMEISESPFLSLIPGL